MTIKKQPTNRENRLNSGSNASVACNIRIQGVMIFNRRVYSLPLPLLLVACASVQDSPRTTASSPSQTDTTPTATTLPSIPTEAISPEGKAYPKTAEIQVCMANDSRNNLLFVENCTQLGAWPNAQCARNIERPPLSAASGVW